MSELPGSFEGEGFFSGCNSITDRFQIQLAPSVKGKRMSVT